MQRQILAFVVFALLAVSVFPAKAQDISSRFVPAQVISATEPTYPPNVVNPGTVVLEVAVGPSGAIQNVKVVRDAPGFTGEALRTVRNWKFRPATLDGQPVRSLVPVAFSFGQPLISQPH